MNAAKLERSDRLQRVRNLLNSGKEYSTMEIVMQANVMAVSACVSELRQQNVPIKCWREGAYFYYQMSA